MRKTFLALAVTMAAMPASAELRHNVKTSVETRSTSTPQSIRDTDAYKAEYAASYLASIDRQNTAFIRGTLAVTNSSVALNSLDNDLINQTTDDEDHLILRLREAWWQVDRPGGYQKDAITAGLKRIRMSPYWIDDEIESVSWDVETTKTSWLVGLGQQLGSYNTSTTLNEEDRSKLAVWGQLEHDWKPYHSLHTNALFVSQHDTVDTEAVPSSYLGPLNGNYLWLGLGTSHNWLQKNDITSRYGYLFELTTLLGDGDRFTPKDNQVQSASTQALSVQGGFRIQPTEETWYLGTTLAYASGSSDGRKSYFQSGYESNKGTYLGTGESAYQFNYAFNASLSNLVSASLFSAIEMDDSWSINGAVSTYMKASEDAPAYRRHRALETSGNEKNLGTGFDVEATYRANHMFTIHNKFRVKLRASHFMTGQALSNYDDETRFTFELMMEL